VKFPERFPIVLALAGLTLAGFFFFPGHTWLQSDTQIYVPILEHLEDAHLLAKDPVALRPHVTWTIYDEVARWTRQATGLEFKSILQLEQILFRFVGLLGVFLLGRAAGLSRAGGLFVAAAFGLGAVVNGPAVLTFEYEPVPRGFAVLLLFGAMGLAASGRIGWAAAAAALAALYHPPTTAPFWAVAAAWLVSRQIRDKAWKLLAGAAVAAVLLSVFARFQQGETEAQSLFGRIDDSLAALQRMRGAYNWIELWPKPWLWQYPLLALVTAGAWLRLRKAMNATLRWFSAGMALFGLAMIPATWLLLDVARWILMPQFQPARAVLFVTAFAVILSAAAGWVAAGERRWPEALAWLLVVFAVPLNGLVLPLFSTGLATPLGRRRLLAALALAAIAAGAAWLAERRWAAVAVVALFLPLWAVPRWGDVHNYPDLHQPELKDLIGWSRGNTAPPDVFLFADGGHSLDAGIFRAEARRNLYVDWKSGGQVNILKEFAHQWWRRWSAVNEARLPLLPLDEYRRLGIDYLVLAPAHAPPDAKVVYRNAAYAVVPLR
jgi:hypothetical protein